MISAKIPKFHKIAKNFFGDFFKKGLRLSLIRVKIEDNGLCSLFYCGRKTKRLILKLRARARHSISSHPGEQPVFSTLLGNPS